MAGLALNTRLLMSERLLGSAFQKAMTQKRQQQTAPKLEENGGRNRKEKKAEAKASKSFCFNVFRGDLVMDQVFPYPEVLSDTDKAKLKEMVEHYTIWGRGGRVL